MKKTTLYYSQPPARKQWGCLIAFATAVALVLWFFFLWATFVGT
jgi:hypothetical protein